MQMKMKHLPMPTQTIKIKTKRMMNTVNKAEWCVITFILTKMANSCPKALNTVQRCTCCIFYIKIVLSYSWILTKVQQYIYIILVWDVTPMKNRYSIVKCLVFILVLKIQMKTLVTQNAVHVLFLWYFGHFRASLI